jgi:replication fork protection complex subunit Csm3/Swi3
MRFVVSGFLMNRTLTHLQFSDVSQLLNAYQLWLDDLYPRAKFTDALGMIEKLGHSKRMQVMRREWINAGKQQHDSSENGPANGEATSSRPKTGVSILGSGIHTLQKGSLSTPVEMPISTDPELSNVQSLETAPQPEQDELDALLAESFSLPSGIPTTASKQPDLGPHQPEHEMDDFEDEMAALAEMEDY